MHAMVSDDCHPDVSLSDWDCFSNEVSPFLIEKVLDRSETRLPNWCLPLARGAAIPSSYLLRGTGYSTGCCRARGWFKRRGDVLFKDLGRDCLIVQRCKPFWRIARDVGAVARPHDHPNFALVHIFGSTPIITRTYQEATYLAEFCSKKGPLPAGLCWVHECPDDINGTIDFALQRGVDEALARNPHRSLVV
jgi:hypothetical protein